MLKDRLLLKLVENFHQKCYFQQMLKFTRQSPLDVERRAASSLAELLESIPIITLQNIEHEEENLDFIARVRSNDTGREYVIGCEVKSSGQPRYAETALLQLDAWRAKMPEMAYVIFIAPYISPNVRNMCSERNVGYFDLTGNCLINLGPVYIERAVADTPPAEQRELKSLYKTKSARVLRVLLTNPRREWKLIDLSAVSGVSLGHVSNVRNALRDRNWVKVNRGSTVLVQPDQLLDEWRENYEVEGEAYEFYTTLHGTALKNRLVGALNANKHLGPVAVMSSYSAADWIAPYGRVSKNYFYADHAGLQNLAQVLSLKPVSSGSNLQIIIPKDDGVFLDYEEPHEGWICTGSVQTYLDLYVSGERGREAAEYLREEKLQW